ncbi:M56 family metallopeptidase [Dokdonia sp. Hel_I_53]|uniref:M56 family metallopeptidase n=1 Tax=Dokdonia sp. Hel_I_53 TaxID=1566287 RepID=UPI0011AA062A|nr:M56 family metallopeptidase [Dokdonia sp. Hel_I_53]
MIGILSAIILPLVIFEKLKEVRIPLQSSFSPARVSDLAFIPSENVLLTNTPIDWWHVVLIIYFVGVFLMSIRFIIQLLSLLKLISSGVVIKKNKGYTFIHCEQKIAPFSFFSFIVYNNKLHTNYELKLVLEHEKVHAGQWHSIDILVSQIILIIQWCNPIAWLYKKSVEENLEYIADCEAVQKIHNIKEYQRSLVKVSSALNELALTNQFYKSFIKKRIIMLNTPQSRKRNLWKLSLVLPFLSVFMYSFNVKEVIKYVEEDDTAFAKAEIVTPSINTGRDLFYIDTATDDKKLNRIEKYVADHWKNIQIKFGDRLFTNENRLAGFTLLTRFSLNENFQKQLTINSENFESSNQYSIMVDSDKEIIFSDTTSLLSITPDQIVSRISKASISSNLLTNHNTKLKSLDSVHTPLSKIESRHISDSLILKWTYSFKITKYTAIEELQALTKILKEKYDTTLEYSDVDYNAQEEITNIRLEITDPYNNTKKYGSLSSYPIADIYIYNDVKWGIGIGTLESIDYLKPIILSSKRDTLSQKFDSLNTVEDYVIKYALQEIEERKTEIRNRIEVSNRLQNNIAVDSLKTSSIASGDSLKLQMLQQLSPQSTLEKATIGKDSLTGRGEGHLENIQENWMYFIDNKETSYTEVLKLDPSTIKHISILQGKVAIAKYGDKGKDGVMLIELK